MGSASYEKPGNVSPLLIHEIVKFVKAQKAN
jgi:hypothetical protein